MLHQRLTVLAAALSIALTATTQIARADDDNCRNLPSQSALKAALIAATAAETSGLNMQMWGTIVDRDGVVCAVAFTGSDRRGTVARQPGHLRPEGEYRERLQRGCLIQQQRFRPARRPVFVHG